MNFDASQIARATGGELLRDAPAGPVLTDTRTLVEGSWFLALSGERFDGHAFADKAAAAGATGAVFSREVDGWTGGEVRVADTTRAYQDLGRAARDRLKGPVIALTGSAGKTTTRAMIALAVGELGHVHQTVGNLNNHLGVPMTLLAAPEDAGASVVEMGTSSHGEIAVLADIGRPDVRLVLNVGASHLQELGGLEGVAAEKGALFASARAGDLVIKNFDDRRVMGMPTHPRARVLTFGSDPGCHVVIEGASIVPETLSTRVALRVDRALFEFTVPSPGVHLASNAAAALTVALGLGLDLRRAADSLAAYEPVGMRLRREELPGDITAINDAYNANPESMRASLRMLAQLPGRRVAVIGDMLELGAGEARMHREVVELAGSLGLDLLVLVGPRMCAAASPGAHAFEEATDAAPLLRDFLTAGDVVLFKGSRGAKVERVLHALRDEVT
ncbi:MAG: UDP-N-acetylmuramoyl-tripeptide--D-alanyl-D-alanine ligase [Deltaproteobacteria bacterium]|nr:MAG: UDP-N-acetylmuramoyl-tripeptide--D-alanyl-D-alanine ligase [Deltaproteobacteria bacterium]